MHKIVCREGGVVKIVFQTPWTGYKLISFNSAWFGNCVTKDHGVLYDCYVCDI